MKTLKQFADTLGVITSAKTHKGLMAAIHAHGFSKNRRFIEFEKGNMNYSTSPGKFHYKKLVAVRKENPDAKRALKDKKFRKNWIARLKNEVRKINNPKLTTAEEIIKAVKESFKNQIRFGHINQSLKIAKVNTKLEYNGPTFPAIYRLYRLNSFSEKQAKRELNLTPGRQWSIRAGLTNKIIADVDNESVKHRGNWRTVTSADHRAQYSSFAFVEKDCLAVVQGEAVRRLKIPGCHFTMDGALVCLVRGEMDYHPLEKEIINGDIKSMLKNMDLNWERRKALKKEKEENEKAEELFLKDVHTTYVTLHDSRMAGNCVEGSLRFAEIRLKVSREDILRNYLFKVPAKRLIDSGDKLAYNAAKMAWKRETLVCI